MMTALFFMFITSCFASLTDEVVHSLENASTPFGALVAGYGLSTGKTPGFGHFSASAGASMVRFEIENPISEGSSYNLGVPSIHGEIQIGIWNGRHMPMSGVTFFKTALVGRYGVVVVPGAVGSGKSGSIVPYYSAGIKVGVIQGGLLFPDASLTAVYTKSSEIDLFSLPRSAADTTFEVSVKPEAVSVFIDVSKRLFYLCPYFGVGINLSDINGEFSIYPASGDPHVTAFSRGSVKKYVKSFVWRTGTEISLFPLLSADAEFGMTGEKWILSLGARISL